MRVILTDLHFSSRLGLRFISECRQTAACWLLVAHQIFLRFPSLIVNWPEREWLKSSATEKHCYKCRSIDIVYTSGPTSVTDILMKK